MSKYLEFKKFPYKGKTERFEVVSKSSGFVLGRISWYGAWRQYTFSPSFETVWNKDCLKDIQDFLESLMNYRKIIKQIENPKKDILKGKTYTLDCQGIDINSQKGKLSGIIETNKDPRTFKGFPS